MAAIAQRGRARRDPSSSSSGPDLDRWHGPVRRDPSCGAIVGHRGKPDRRARGGGDRTRRFAAFARSSNGGLIATQSASALGHRRLILTLASRHRLPAVYINRFWAADGGLMSYGVNVSDEFHRAAGYIDRILRGEKPADSPVQAPVKYELVINLNTAKALGLEVPATLLARADKVIE